METILTTTATYYSVLDYINGTVLNANDVYPSRVNKECDNCHQRGLEPEFRYCPNCGRKFKNE